MSASVVFLAVGSVGGVLMHEWLLVRVTGEPLARLAKD
jgi:hypothetical protein